MALVDKDENGAQETFAAIDEGGGQALVITADVSDFEQVRAAIDQVCTMLGVPRILVNNAGILRIASILDTSNELFSSILSTNLFSVFYFSREVARQMINSEVNGSIVNVSSIHAVLAEPNGGAYTAAKGGIEALSRTMASEWARQGVRVNCVRPGAIRTALSEPLYTPEVLAGLSVRIPMGTIGSPEQIAAGICFLASDDADYITGTTLDIDGGYVMDGSLPGPAYS